MILRTALTLGVALAALLDCRPCRAAQTAAPVLTPLYSFTTFNGDGRYPSAGVVIGSKGLLYGTTPEGGTTSAGTVYSLAPPATTGGAWTETVLYRFDRHDGAFPYAGVVIGAGGILYGTTFDGGTGANCYDSVLKCGVVFSLAPPATPGGAWTESVLYTFSGGSDGSNPGGLVIGAGGVLYGTTSAGGSAGLGTVFAVTPPASQGGAWTETVLHNFTGPDGSGPSAPLIIGRHGVLYGTTSTGGAGACASGCGTVFSLTPPASQGGTWTETVLHSFAGSPGDGANPVGLVMDTNGDLFGTTSAGGTATCATYPPCGTVFSMTPPSAAGGDWTEQVLYNFPTTSGGFTPGAGVVIVGGVLYGTTSNGGDGAYGNYGTVYSLTPPTSSGGAWTETVLHSFSGGNDGAHPTDSLVLGRDGLLYGTASQGGSGKFGTVFSLRP